MHPRSGSKVWQFQLPAPPDLAHHFTSQWAERKSLGTSDLKKANAKALLWAAEWAIKFEQLRRQDRPKQHASAAAQVESLPIVALTTDLITQAAA